MSLRHPAITGIALSVLLFFAVDSSVWAQTGNHDPQTSGQTQSTTSPDAGAEPVDNPKYLLKHLGQDQLAIWTSPFRAKIGNLKWLVPAAGITTGLIMTDRTASHESARLTGFNSSTFSNIGLAFAGGASVGFYLLGKTNGNRQLSETGVLGGEAMVDSFVVFEALKYAFQRQRPIENNGAGRFFQSGSQRAFPSGHATMSFAFASVLAHEYNGWLSQFLAYGGATAISLARVTGKQHFPSDVFVGGAIGYLIGRQVYHAHHDPDLDLNYGTFDRESKLVTLTSAGSTYVALDSWIYPALERLIALNIIHRPFLGLRPWTRTTIAQMLAEARVLVEDNPEQSQEVVNLYSALKAEFSQELGLVDEGNINQSMRLESLYAGVYPIAGTPLNDSYHFGQTIVNNFGRPYWQGLNAVTGFTSRAEAGRFFFYARGEYQHAPGAPAYPAAVRTTILQIDQNCQFNSSPPPSPQPCSSPAGPVSEAKQFRMLDTYVGFTVIGNEITVGKQSLWWGPGEGGAFILSNNAEPIYMVRINRTIPLNIPLISKLLGPLRYDNFFGKTYESNFPTDPFFYGDKLTFQPTENFEFGVSRTGIFAGQGHQPLTFRTFRKSFFNFADTTKNPNVKFTTLDPGARHGNFDFSYKLPYLRNWITLYADAMVHDEPSPLAAPRRAAVVPGIYISHFPKLNRLDLRAESGYTDIAGVGTSFQQGGHFLYFEQIYHNAYTNKGNLMGSWIGRDGKGTQVWSNYWLGGSSYIQLSYRNAKASAQFIPGGTTQNDFAAGARLRVRKDVELLTNFQYERWDVPILAPNQKSDFLTSIQVTFWPKEWVKRKPN